MDRNAEPARSFGALGICAAERNGVRSAAIPGLVGLGPNTTHCGGFGGASKYRFQGRDGSSKAV